jgi:hypothetical protein
MPHETSPYPRRDGANEHSTLKRAAALGGLSTETARVQANAGKRTTVKRLRKHRTTRQGCGSTRERRMGRGSVAVSPYPLDSQARE